MSVTIQLHPQVLTEDVPRLFRSLPPGRRQEAQEQIERAIQEILRGQGVPQKDMEPPYRGWYRKKLHSLHRPPAGASADLRILYQWSEDGATLRILAIGRRLLGTPEDIYQIAAGREREF